MVVYTLEQRWEILRQIDLQKVSIYYLFIIIEIVLNCFAKQACDRLTEDADFGKKKVIFSDEAYFDLGGYAEKRSNIVAFRAQKTRMHTLKRDPKRVTVWCGVLFRGIIVTFFFENDQGETVTVNGNRQWAMLN